MTDLRNLDENLRENTNREAASPSPQKSLPSKYATLEEKPPAEAENSDNNSDDTDEKDKTTPWYAWPVRILLFCAIAAVVMYFIFNHDKIKVLAEKFLDWLSEHKFFGPLVLVAILAVT